MSRFIPVGPEKWAEMVKAQADLPRWKEMCDELDARCNELKSEVERLNALIISGGAIVPDAKPVEDIEAENARLKAEVERLRKAAVTGGYNLSEYIRMANSETLEFDNGDIFAEMTLPERIKYIVESHARLKAEVERLQNNCNYLDRELDMEIDKTAMLCGQVERLRKAGDGLGWAVHRLKERFWDADEEANKAIHDWNAAKDGKPTE